jgi:CheY-like chemotaxis protein
MYRILVAEDHALTGELLTDVLSEPPGWQVTAVVDGAQALHVLETQRIDLVVLDVNLPLCNGLEVYRRLRAQPNGATVPVLFVTANMQALAHHEELTGPHAWLAKPFDIEEVLQVAAALLGEAPQAEGRPA